VDTQEPNTVIKIKESLRKVCLVVITKNQIQFNGNYFLKYCRETARFLKHYRVIKKISACELGKLRT
jgi:hypothetical protein